MTLHAFVDESTRRGRYLLGLTTCADADLATARRALRALRLPGQRRLHFAAEGDNQRRCILSGISGMGMCSTVYVADHDNQQDARAAILERAAHDLAGASVSRLTIESRAGQDHHDRAVLYRAFGPMPPLSYGHLTGPEEPLLWVPDAVAWAYGRGSTWKAQLDRLGLIEAVTQVTVP